MTARIATLAVLLLAIVGGLGMTEPKKQEQTTPPADAGAFPEPVAAPRFFPKAQRAQHGMVSAAHPLASKTGVTILRQGGNAIDAMVAVQMVLNVVEPQSSGIGGGSFILYYDAATGQVHAIDGREECPAGANRQQFLDAQGKLLKDEEVLTGGHCVGVPGTVAAMYHAHKKWGKLSWKQVLDPAIRLASQGIGMTPRLRWAIEANRQRFLLFPSSRAAFLEPEGSVAEIGQILRQPELAQSLQRLADNPGDFYQGKIAEMIVAAVQGSPVRPGSLRLEDLKNYRVLEREPIRFKYHDYELVGFPPPSSGTITLAQMLGMAEQSPKAQRPPSSVAEIDFLARAESAAFADRNVYLGDQDWSDMPMALLMDPDRIRQRWQVAQNMKPGQRLSPGSRPGGGPAAPLTEQEEGTDTTHYAIVDADRNFVACTTTIEHGMGSGLVVPGGGFLLNNQLTDFDLKVETGPNALDVSAKPRKTALNDSQSLGHKRPRSSMTPMIVFRNGKPILTVGSPGGTQIIGVVNQALLNVLDHGMDMQQALNAPRVSCRNLGSISLEGHFPERERLVKELRAMGWKIKPLAAGYEAWGGAHGIRLLPDGTLEGGADPRREGAVRGY
jgi:gamma-glutamyltranspeptidase / glutathione hydrolase